MKDVEPAV